MVDRVFSLLWSSQLNLMVAEKNFIDIGFIEQAFQDKFKLTKKHNAIEVMQYMFLALTAEIADQDMLTKVFLNTRQNQDILNYHKAGIVNQLFSFQLVKKFECQTGHKSDILMNSVGLDVKKPGSDQSLKDLLKYIFAMKLSSLTCTTCGINLGE